MIKERHMVTGKRVDNGETVMGYYVRSRSCNDRGDGHVIRVYRAASVEVDPATVEPVAVGVKWIQPTADEILTFCPNCETELGGYDDDKSNYCPWCGMRLDWSVI